MTIVIVICVDRWKDKETWEETRKQAKHVTMEKLEI